MAVLQQPVNNGNAFADIIGDDLAPAGTYVATILDIKDEFEIQRQRFQSTELETVDLAEAIQTGREPAIPGREGLAAVELIGGIYESAKSGIPVVEDCAQIHGAKYKGRMVGTLGTISSFSLMFGKHHATGGQGGMVFTQDEALYWKVRRYADRGKPFGIENAPNGNVVHAINCNMDELHATIGRAQLKKLPNIIARRQKVAKTIAERCRQELKAIRLKEEPADCEGVYWFLFFECDEAQLSVSKDDVAKAVAAEGIPVNSTYKHVPTRMEWMGKYMQQQGLSMADDRRYGLVNVDRVDARYFMCMMHEDYTSQEVDDIMSALAKVEAAYLK